MVSGFVADSANSRVFITALLAVSCSCAGNVFAGEWRAQTAASVSEIYSDNIELTDGDEEDKFVTVLTPSVHVTGKGRRANMDVAASLQLSDYSNSSEDFRPGVNGSGQVELYRNHFFVDVDAQAGQSTINPFAASGVQGRGSQGVSGITGTGNETNTYTAGISPYFVSRIRNIADFQLRYRYDEQYNSSSEVDDSARESASFSLSSGSDFSVLSWGLSGSYSQTNYAGNTADSSAGDNELINANLQLGYRLSRKWQLTASYGQEWNDFVAANPDIDDQMWTAGLVWTPNTRTSLRLSHGSRFFGNTPSVDFSYRHKRSRIEASYAEQLTDTRSLRAQPSYIVLATQNGLSLVFDPQTGKLLVIPENQVTQGNSTLVNKQADISYGFSARRTEITVFARQSKQTRLELDDESIFSSFGINIGRDLSAKVDLDTSLSWSRQEDTINAVSDVAVVYVGLNRRLANSATMTLGVSHAERDSERENDNYRENRVNFTVRIDF